MATAAGQEGDDPSYYYDILLLGRTGQGKSTTGNKLLTSEGEVRQVHSLKSLEAASSDVGDEEQRAEFKAAEGEDSVTAKCELISNEATRVRVLDTPGFADTENTRERGVFNGNLEIFRDIVRIQDERDLAFSRVLYFLPSRGRLERADGALQEEIKLMYGFLGEDVFKIMVIVATTFKCKKKYEDFDDDDVKATERAFMKAFNKITGEAGLLERCPPIVYLPFDEENALNRVVGAEVIYEEFLKVPVIIEFSSFKPSMMQDLIQEAKRKNEGRKLLFRDRCIKCCGKLIYEDSPRGKKPVLILLNEGSANEKIIPYGDSKCHPLLLPKHATVTKIIGGIAHIATLGIFVGIGKVRGKKLWPGFTNSDEYCVGCKGPPSAEGCSKINKTIKLTVKSGHEKILTTHSTKLEKLQLDNSE